MFATYFEFQVAEGREEDFIAGWEHATRGLREVGSEGSALFRNDSGQFCAFARWPDRATRDSAFQKFGTAGFEAMADCLSGSTRRVDLEEVANLWADFREL